MENIFGHFEGGGKILYCGRYGNGHINETYLVVNENARQFILQKINTSIFKNPAGLMENISAVLKHLKLKSSGRRETMSLVPTRSGESYLELNEGGTWRMYDFVCDSLCLNKTPTVEEFAESGRAFGSFRRQLADFPAHTLHETIPNFHNTPARYKALYEVIKNDSFNRVKDVGKEIEFALEREQYSNFLVNLLEKGELPLCVTHNDTKLNNVLLDRVTKKALCIIDLDTVMPGLSVYDFGDSIRFGASTAAEDEKDLDKVAVSLELFEAYSAAYIEANQNSMSKTELDCLYDGAKMMTLECGVRFLTDYLDGDQYFATHRPNHNLDRARTQFKLVADMEKKENEMRKIIR